MERWSSVLAGALVFAACGAPSGPGGDAKAPPPAPASTNASASRPAPEPVEAAVVAPTVTLLEPGAEPRRALRYAPAAGLHVFSLTLASKLAVDVGISAIPPTDVPPLHVEFEAQAQRRDDGSFEVSLVPTQVEAVAGEGSAALAAGMAPTIAALRQLRARLVVGSNGALTHASFTLPPTPGAGGPTDAERLENALVQLFVPLPDEPIGLGARWTATRTLPFAGNRIEQTTTFTLRALDQDRLTVELALEQRPTAGTTTSTTPPDGIRTTVDALRTTGQGEMELDLTRVGPISARSSSHSDLTQTIERDGQRQQVSLSLDLNLEARAPPPPAP